MASDEVQEIYNLIYMRTVLIYWKQTAFLHSDIFIHVIMGDIWSITNANIQTVWCLKVRMTVTEEHPFCIVPKTTCRTRGMSFIRRSHFRVKREQRDCNVSAQVLTMMVPPVCVLKGLSTLLCTRKLGRKMRGGISVIVATTRDHWEKKEQAASCVLPENQQLKPQTPKDLRRIKKQKLTLTKRKHLLFQTQFDMKLWNDASWQQVKNQQYYHAQYMYMYCRRQRKQQSLHKLLKQKQQQQTYRK